MKLFSNYKIMIIVTLFAFILSPHHYGSLNDGIEWIEILKTIVFCISVFFISNIFCYLLENTKLKEKSDAKWIKIFIRILFYAVPLISISIEWILSFPAKLSTDSYVQLYQIENNVYSDVHPAAHTLFCKILMQIYNSPAIVILVQILSLCLITGYAFDYFYKKGISYKILVPILVIWSCLGPIRIVTCFFWKDVFFSIGILLETVVLIKLLDQKEKPKIIDLILGGLALAIITLFRHNGIVIYFTCIILYTFLIIKNRKKRFEIPIIISLVLILFVKLVVYNFFEILPNDNGTKYALPAKAIISVVYNDGNYTEEQLQKIEQLLPKDVIKTYYDLEIGQGLLWRTVSIADTPSFSDTLNGKEKIITELFIELFPKNIGIMLRDMWGSSSLMLKFQYDNKTTCANQELMKQSLSNNFDYGNFLDHNMTYMFLLILCMIMLIKHKKNIYLLPFLPVLANVASIVISNISYEARYAYPTICCTAILIVYTIYVLNNKND